MNFFCMICNEVARDENTDVVCGKSCVTLMICYFKVKRLFHVDIQSDNTKHCRPCSISKHTSSSYIKSKKRLLFTREEENVRNVEKNKLQLTLKII